MLLDPDSTWRVNLQRRAELLASAALAREVRAGRRPIGGRGRAASGLRSLAARLEPTNDSETPGLPAGQH